VARFSMLEDVEAFEIALAENEIDYEEVDEVFEIKLDADNVDRFLAFAPKYVHETGAIAYAGARTGVIFDEEVVELSSVEDDRKIASRVGSPTAMEFLNSMPFLRDMTFHNEYGTMINSGELTGT